MAIANALLDWIRTNGQDSGFGYAVAPANMIPLPLRKAIRPAEESGLVARNGDVLEVVESQFQWHYKMPGYRGPCPVCGCEAARLKARHRALPADEAFRLRGHWEKVIKVSFGTDFSREVIP